MRALHLALSLIRVPRLFASLFLLPLLLSLLVVAAQLFVTAVFIQASTVTTESVENRLDTRKDMFGLLRKVVLGSYDPLPPAELCRWGMAGKGSASREVFPRPACAPNRLDVAIRTATPETTDVRAYQKLFEGNAKAIHVCRSCRPDLIIDISGETPRTEIRSVWALLLLQMVSRSDTVDWHVREMVKDKDRVHELLGERSFTAAGYARSLELSTVNVQLAAVLNVASLVIISLWLALKAHKKVLDYFARNGALLPMVAATGKHSFYSSIWLLTAFRVGAFLCAAVPATVALFLAMAEDQQTPPLYRGGWTFPLVWVLAVGASFSLATLIASIADLKQRHNLLGFMYLYAPMMVCGFGALLWLATFLVDGAVVGTLRTVVTALPVVGMVPIIFSPLLQPTLLVLLTHAFLATLAIVVYVRGNARWFAAHLEEL